MLKSKYAILVGAAAAAMPLAAKGVVITYTFNLNDIYYSTSSNGTYTLASAGPTGTLTGTAAAPVITVPSGDFIKIGVNALVTGDTYAGNSIDPAETLGIAAYQVGLSDSNVAAAYVAPGGAAGTTLTTPVINSDFTGSKGEGTTDGTGGVNATLGTLGANSFNGLTYNTAMSYGSTTPAELYNSLKIKSNGSTGATATFTLTNNSSAFQYVVSQTPGHVTAGGSTAPGTFKNQTFNPATDTFSAMPTLTVIVGTPGGSTGPTTHPIISLISSSSTPATGYGNADGTITMTGKGYGSYNVSTAAGFTAATTGGIDVKGFNPTSDTEVYALKLTSNGVAISGTQITTVIADINGGNGNVAAAGVTASAITGVYTNLFPGYEILLTSSAGITDDAELNFDFSSAGEADSAVPGLVLTGVAAVPEPATAAGVVLGAAGLLLGRRRNRVTIA